MPVESATYISDLVVSNPLHTDGIAQADSHLRLIKSVLQATFPSITGAVTVGATEINNMGVPIGAILIWSGAANGIPAGYALCDGTSGTPNLCDSFVIGAGAGYAVGGTGGALTNTATTATDGAHTHTGYTASGGDHTHTASNSLSLSASGTASSVAVSSATSTATPTGSVTGTVDAHALSIAELPSHSHGLGGEAIDVGTLGTSSTWSFQNTGTGVNIGVSSVSAIAQGSGTAHSHTWSGSLSLSTPVSTSVTTGVTTTLSALPVTGSVTSTISTEAAHVHGISSTDSTHYHTVTVPVLPPYYALCYIMRIL